MRLNNQCCHEDGLGEAKYKIIIIKFLNGKWFKAGREGFGKRISPPLNVQGNIH